MGRAPQALAEETDSDQRNGLKTECDQQKKTICKPRYFFYQIHTKWRMLEKKSCEELDLANIVLAASIWASMETSYI